MSNPTQGASAPNQLPIPVEERPVVQLIDSCAVTTSVEVARCFKKRHSDVLRRIEKLDCSSEFNERNFALVDYCDDKGESRPMYRITRDGFVFLAMGFTGARAATFKEAYINAFNEMEKKLREESKAQGGTLPAPVSVADAEKYRLLNAMIDSMRFSGDYPVLLPGDDVVEMVRTVRRYQIAIKRIKFVPEWENDVIERVKQLSGRNFCDDHFREQAQA